MAGPKLCPKCEAHPHEGPEREAWPEGRHCWRCGYVPDGATSGGDAGELDELTVAELKSKAAERGIDVPGKATKAELVEALGGER